MTLWNAALSTIEINALGSIDPKIENAGLGARWRCWDVEISGTRDNIALMPNVHPKVDLMPSIVTQDRLAPTA